MTKDQGAGTKDWGARSRDHGQPVGNQPPWWDNAGSRTGTLGGIILATSPLGEIILVPELGTRFIPGILVSGGFLEAMLRELMHHLWALLEIRNPRIWGLLGGDAKGVNVEAVGPIRN